LLLAARERAEQAGMTVIAVAADEELRGPFLVARSIMGSVQAIEVASDSPGNDPLRRCLSAMSGEDDPSLASLPADQRLLRTLDLGAVAFRALAGDHGLAVLIDDVQWADDDSLRLLRYVVRANATNPILLLFAIRPEEFALVTEAVNLIADMDRMGVVRRLRVNRFTPAETRSFLAETLDGRRAEAERGEQLAAEEVERFRAWRASLAVVPAIASLRAHAEEIRAAELARRPDGEGLFRIMLALVAEAAAHVLRHDAQAPFVEAELLADVAADVMRRLRAAGIRSMCSVPLLAGDRLLGTLNAGSVRDDGCTGEELELLTQVANQLVIAVDNALAFHKIDELKEKLLQPV